MLRRLFVLGSTFVLGVAFVGACGSNVGAGVSLAQARATCLAWDNDPAGVEALILVAENARDIGVTKGLFIATLNEACVLPEETNGSACSLCVLQMTEAVWP